MAILNKRIRDTAPGRLTAVVAAAAAAAARAFLISWKASAVQRRGGAAAGQGDHLYRQFRECSDSFKYSFLSSYIARSPRSRLMENEFVKFSPRPGSRVTPLESKNSLN